MVDKERRKKLALHLRHLSVGLATNDDFEEAIMEDVSDGWTPENYYRSEKAKSAGEAGRLLKFGNFDGIVKGSAATKSGEQFGIFGEKRVNQKLTKSGEY